MSPSNRKTAFGSLVGVVVSAIIYAILLFHNAWGDGRYELKHDAIIKEISNIDTQLAIKDTEILFSESDKEKEKLKAIQAVYARKKQALNAALMKD